MAVEWLLGLVGLRDKFDMLLRGRAGADLFAGAAASVSRNSTQRREKDYTT